MRYPHLIAVLFLRICGYTTGITELQRLMLTSANICNIHVQIYMTNVEVNLFYE